MNNENCSLGRLMLNLFFSRISIFVMLNLQYGFLKYLVLEYPNDKNV